MKTIKVPIESPYPSTYGKKVFEKGNNSYLAEKLFDYIQTANGPIQSIKVTPRIDCEGYDILIELGIEYKENAEK